MAAGRPPIIQRERMRNRRVCLHCCADRAAPASPPSCAPRGWQPHTVRSFLAAVVRKKLGLHLESEKTDGERVYRIVAGNRSDSAGEPSA